MAITVVDIFHQLIKSIKTIQLYGISHPSARQIYQPLFHMLSEVIKENGHIEFDIEQYSISYDNRVVYQEREKDISVAYKLFRDGVRNIKIMDGLEFDEMLLFLEIMSQTTREQDIALNLWECNFIHIDFYVIEEEDEDLSYEYPIQDIKNIDLEAKLVGIIAKEKLNMSEQIDPILTEKDLDSLKKQMAYESKEATLTIAISTLINFLQHDKSNEIIESLIEMLAQCIDQHNFYNARLITVSLKEYAKINAVDKYEKETIILDFKNFINTISDESFNQFLAFIALFSKKSLAYFVKLMPSVQRAERLEKLRDNVAYIAQTDYQPLLIFLQSKSADLIVNAIAVLCRIGISDIVDHLDPLRDHQRPEVRSSLVHAYKVFRQPSRIAFFLDDEDPNVRIKALQTLTAVNFPAVYNKLITRIKSKMFHNLDFAEQKETFNCLVANGGPGMTKILRKMLFRWILFGRKRYLVIRKLAALALADINTDEAHEILEQGIMKRNSDIKQACTLGLKR